jgi:tRNA-dependent cyclodipeptide synthase
MKGHVIPAERTYNSIAANRCIYSVSLSLDKQWYGSTLEGFRWATEHFPEVNVYLGDGPLLETTLTLLGVPQEEVRGRARSLAKATIQDLGAISGNYHLTAASALGQDALFAKGKREIERLAKTGARLAMSLQSDARTYLERLARSGRLAIEADRALSLASTYLISEIATYLYLARLGYFVDVYAGGTEELPTLQKFIAGDLEGAPELAARSCIILRPDT